LGTIKCEIPFILKELNKSEIYICEYCARIIMSKLNG